MKRLSILLILSFIQSLAFGQDHYFYTYEYDISSAVYTPIRYFPKKDVNQIEFTKTDKKDKKVKYEKQYASGNRLLKFYEYKNGEKRIRLENTYDQYEKVANSKVYKNGNYKYSLIYKRNSEKKLTEKSKLNADGSIKYKNTWSFNSDGCLEISENYKKGEKLKKRSVNEYYSACDKSKTTLYNGKGKVRKVWTFDCKKEGEELVKKKDVNQVCKWEESDSEYLIKVYQTFDDKGKIYKNVSKYTKEDTLIVESKSFNEDGTMTYFSSYDKSFDRPISRRYYTKKGKLRWGNEYTYENKKVLTHKYMKNGSLKSSSKYEYNNNELLIKYTSLDKKGELLSTIDLQYN